MEQELIRLLDSFSDRYKKGKVELPYHINLIDELHANENAHTRILLKLLQFNYLGNYPILRSFFDLMEQKMERKFKVGEIKHPKIRFNQENIDGLIEESEYVVIIENKIHGAIDQEKQIDRYVEIARKHCLKEDKIFVIYLTTNGAREVLERSFDKAKTLLGYTDRQNTGRFVPMSYRMDILPWLEQVVLPGCMLKDEYLISALQQYIDHLKGMFDLRNEERIMTEKILDEVLGLQGSLADKMKQLSDYKERIDKLASGLELYCIKMLSSVKESLKEEIRRQFSGLLKGDIFFNPDNMGFDCQSMVRDCSLLYFYVDILFPIDGRQSLIRWGLVTDNENKIQEIPGGISEKLKKEFDEFSSFGEGYWLCKKISYTQEEFWNKIKDNSIIDFLRKQYDDMANRLRDIGLYQENN